MHIIALAGLPGTGKSSIARELVRRLDCVVLDKDAVRLELFEDGVDYSSEQDERAMTVLYDRVEALARAGASHVVVDGRTYTRGAHVEALRELARRSSARLTLVECVCEASVARRRLALDHRDGVHPARNRTPELYDELRRRAEPIEAPTVVVDTTNALPSEIVEGLRW